ncbi:MAG: DNA polymerase III subunit epsilon [Bacillota bacterium]|nr:MAG: DNA polymerase III subunit epsilon [Bacillota bacterium]MBS3950531.1 3'-5' exonuclease [Peptococcaceae bacterium]
MSQSLLHNVVFSVVDVETTGLSANRDRVTEVAVVQVRNGQIVHTYTTLINPECDIPPFVQQMTGITQSMVQGAPKFSQIRADIDRLLQGTVLVAHNARFDQGFLTAEFGRCKCALPEIAIVDTVALARRTLHGMVNYRLETLCQHLGLKSGGHRALGDATATAQLFLVLLGAGAEEKIAASLGKAIV